MKFCLYLFVVLLLLSCYSSRDFHRENVDKMRHDSVFSDEKSVVLQGKAVYKMNYCGGAKPPNNYMQTQPFQDVQNTTLIFRKVSDPDMNFKVETDRSGLFSIRLYEGVWRYYLTETFKESNAKNSIEIPTECEPFYNTPYGSLEIEIDHELDTVYFKDLSFYRELESMRDSTKMDSIFFYLPCNPCELSTKP